MKNLIVLVLLILSTTVFSKSKGIIKIEIGGDYNEYSKKDLKRRIWNLERAVWQLQQRVFNLELTGSRSTEDSWICKISSMGNKFSAVGPNKAIAENRVLKKCKSEGDSFFCNDPKCSQ